MSSNAKCHVHYTRIVMSITLGLPTYVSTFCGSDQVEIDFHLDKYKMERIVNVLVMSSLEKIY